MWTRRVTAAAATCSGSHAELAQKGTVTTPLRRHQSLHSHRRLVEVARGDVGFGDGRLALSNPRVPRPPTSSFLPRPSILPLCPLALLHAIAQSRFSPLRGSSTPRSKWSSSCRRLYSVIQSVRPWGAVIIQRCPDQTSLHARATLLEKTHSSHDSSAKGNQDSPGR